MKRWTSILVGLAVFAVVAAVVGIGGGILLENNDQFCSSCHSQPETTYYERSQQSDPTDLASLHHFKETRCIDCHSGQGFLSRIVGVFRFGVADTLAFYSGNYHNPAVTTRPLSNTACTKCHDLGALSGGNAEPGGQNHFHSANLQAAWLAAGGPVNRCNVCHPPHQQIGGATTIYTSQDVVNNGCSICHSLLREGG